MFLQSFLYFSTNEIDTKYTVELALSPNAISGTYLKNMNFIDATSSPFVITPT